MDRLEMIEAQLTEMRSAGAVTIVAEAVETPDMPPSEAAKGSQKRRPWTDGDTQAIRRIHA
jgi:hypothetical protein